MREINLWVVGDGLRGVNVTAGETLQAIATRENLTAYDFSVDGVTIDRSKWSTYTVDHVTEMWASLGVKGAR